MLAPERHVSASTHNQALSALLFLYGTFNGIAMDGRYPAREAPGPGADRAQHAVLSDRRRASRPC